MGMARWMDASFNRSDPMTLSHHGHRLSLWVGGEQSSVINAHCMHAKQNWLVLEKEKIE